MISDLKVYLERVVTRWHGLAAIFLFLGHVTGVAFFDLPPSAIRMSFAMILLLLFVSTFTVWRDERNKIPDSAEIELFQASEASQFVATITHDGNPKVGWIVVPLDARNLGGRKAALWVAAIDVETNSEFIVRPEGGRTQVYERVRDERLSQPLEVASRDQDRAPELELRVELGFSYGKRSEQEIATAIGEFGEYELTIRYEFEPEPNQKAPPRFIPIVSFPVFRPS